MSQKKRDFENLCITLEPFEYLWTYKIHSSNFNIFADMYSKSKTGIKSPQSPLIKLKAFRLITAIKRPHITAYDRIWRCQVIQSWRYPRFQPSKDDHTMTMRHYTSPSTLNEIGEKNTLIWSGTRVKTYFERFHLLPNKVNEMSPEATPPHTAQRKLHARVCPHMSIFEMDTWTSANNS